MVGGALLLVAALAGPSPAAAECSPIVLSGHISHGGSTPLPGAHAGVSVVPSAGGTGQILWDAPWDQAITLTGGPIGEWDYEIGMHGYFSNRQAGHLSCYSDGQCGFCSGEPSGTVYALQGALEGAVKIHPEPPLGFDYSNLKVYLRDEGNTAIVGETGVDMFGGYSFREGPNNWGINVLCNGVPGDGYCSGPGSRHLEAFVDHRFPKAVTVTSDDLAHADVEAYLGEFGDVRQCPVVGQPVSLASGNVYLSQTDGGLTGFSSLSLTRDYNSYVARLGVVGAFGKGWTHSFEQSLSVPSAGQLKLRQGNGVAMYFVDPEGDGTYRASVPRSERSRVVRQANGSYVRELLGGGSETYDANGFLAAVTDVSGNGTTYARDSAGRLLSVTEPGGRSLTFTYNAQGLVEMVSGPLGPLATYVYDGTYPFLREVHHPDGGGYVFTYDWQGQLLRVDDLSGRVVEAHSYDADGRGLTSELLGGRDKYTISYGDRQTTVTDGLGNVTRYDWDLIVGMRRVTKATGCASCGGGGDEAREWTYDELGREKTITYSDGSVVTYEYDADGNRISETGPAGTTTYTYDAGGRVLTRLAPGGVETSYGYDTLGRLTGTTERLTATQTRSTALAYDGQGRTSSITDARGKATGLTYHPSGELATVTDPLGHTTSFAYDGAGRRTGVTDALGHTSTTTYDGMGRVSKVTGPDGAATVFAYDQAGNRTSVTDPLGRKTRYVYNEYGWLSEVVDATAGVTKYEYDVMGHLLALVDAKSQRTSFAYDSRGRVTSTTYPGGAQETYTYDAGGRLQTKTDRKGVVTTYGYDPAGRLAGKSYSDGVTPPVSYSYDAAGRLATAANGTDTLGWTYDLAGQLLTETSSKNASTVGYSYDLGGNRVSLGLDGQVFVTYGYDDASRLVSITRSGQVFGFGYDAANRRTSLSYPNGVVTSYDYDVASRVLDIHAQKSGQTVARSQYSYDASGNRLTKAHPEYAESYRYDDLYRLTGVERVGATPPGRWGYGYDAVGNRLWEQRDEAVTSYAYDERNRLLSTDVGGRMLWRGTLSEAGNVSFTSAQVNGQPARMLPGNVFEAEIPVVGGTNTVMLEARDLAGNATVKQYQVDVAGEAASYSYDANGNLTQKVADGHTWGYEWNAENQLTRVTKDTVEVARFGYDPAGRRVEKVAGVTTTAYTYSSEDILRQATGGASVRYVHGEGIDEPLAVENGAGQLLYEHVDALGSELKRTDGAGAVAMSSLYEAFGEPAGAAAAGYAYTGREWDPEIGLYYYRARYYDPKVGRFVSEDPIKFRGADNFYAYVDGNPLRYRDPTGLVAEPCDCAPCAPNVERAGKTVCDDAKNNDSLPPPIRKCIQAKCASGYRLCCPKKCSGPEYGSSMGTGDVTLCPTGRSGSDCRLKQTVLHEMMHSCMRTDPDPGSASHSTLDNMAKRAYPCPGEP